MGERMRTSKVKTKAKAKAVAYQGRSGVEEAERFLEMTRGERKAQQTAPLPPRTNRRTILHKAGVIPASVIPTSVMPTSNGTGTMVALPQDEVRVLANKRDMAQAMVEGTVVTDAKTCATAAELLTHVAKQRREIEARRTAMTKPLNEGLRQLNAFFKQFTEPLDEADKELRRKILVWRNVEEQRVAEEQRKRDEETRQLAHEAETKRLAAEKARGAKAELLREQSHELEQEALTVANKTIDLAPARVTATSAGNMTSRKVWTFRVTDESLVPREYLVVDERKIRAAVNSGLREILGVEIVQESQLAVGGR